MSVASRRRRPARPVGRHYPRMARVNEVLREVLAEAIEVEATADPRLELATVTAVQCDPDLRHATVLMASLPEGAREALGEARYRLQAAIAHQVRIKRTPLLSFEADPAVAYGEKVEDILRDLRAHGQLGDDEPEETGDGAIVPDASEAPHKGPEAGGPAPGLAE